MQHDGTRQIGSEHCDSNTRGALTLTPAYRILQFESTAASGVLR
jgi:hypothetical protein